jgi:5-(carboxyamino)imidazole ribonucleotide synthase
MLQDKKIRVIGILGGGQLARMMAVAAAELGFEICIFSNKEDSPAFQLANYKILASYDDLKSLAKFSKLVDVVCFEFENIPLNTLKFLQDNNILRPNILALEISQNRLLEKKFFNDLGIQTAQYQHIKSLDDLSASCKKFGGNAMLKTATNGYDGKGQFSIDNKSDISKIWHAAQALNLELILEEKINFIRELSLVAARDIYGNIIFYDMSYNIHENSILKESYFPAEVSEVTKKMAQNIATKTLEKLDYIGVLAIEFFECANSLIVNEFAPRPHNSGHYSIDACLHSQFEQSIRAAVGMQVIEPELIFSGKMVNLLGDDIELSSELAKNSKVKLHLYGKKDVVKGRKLGHYVVLDKK